MLLLYSTGVRVSELVNIKRDEIDFDNKVIYINNGKGGFSGVVPLTDLVIKYIKAYIKKEKSEYLFKGIRGKYSVTSVRNIVKNAKIGVTPHLFRHSLITEIVKKDGIYAAKEIARHKNTKSTEWYIHFDKDHLQKIYNPLNIAI